MTQNETWMPVAGYPNYAVSDKGNVLNVKFNRPVAGYVRPDGYRYVTLEGSDSRRVVPIHILVAESFSQTYLNSQKRVKRKLGRQDGDINNNGLDNLSFATGRRIVRDLPTHESVKKRRIEVVETGLRFDTVLEVSEHLGVTIPSIYRVLNGTRSTVVGVHLKYTWDS